MGKSLEKGPASEERGDGRCWSMVRQARPTNLRCDINGFCRFVQIGDLNCVHHLWQFADLEERRVRREQSWSVPGWVSASSADEIGPNADDLIGRDCPQDCATHPDDEEQNHGANALECNRLAKLTRRATNLHYTFVGVHVRDRRHVDSSPASIEGAEWKS